MKVRFDFDWEMVDEQRQRLVLWIDAAEAGDMTGEEMIDRLSAIVDELDDQVAVLRRAVG